MGFPAEKKSGPSILMMIGKDKGKPPEDEPDTKDEGDEDVSDNAVQDLAEAFGIDPAKVDVAKARAAIEDICESKYGAMKDEG